jgi:transcriptional regulator with XRE-family HTH domain
MAEHRRVDLEVAGAREAAALSATLGGVVRSERRRKRRTQSQLGERVGLTRSRISEIERGLGAGAPLEAWIALGMALDRPLAVSFTRSVSADAPADAGHLALQELALRLAARHGIRGTFELPSRPSDPARSIDVGLRDDAGRRLILEECWNTIADLGAAARSSTRKLVEAADLATVLGDGGTAYGVHLVWLIRPTAANRELVRRYPSVFRSRFPGSSARWARAINEGGPPPEEPGIVWLDPSRACAVPIRLADLP